MSAITLGRGGLSPYTDLRREFDNWSRPKLTAASGSGRSHYVLYIRIADFVARSVDVFEGEEAETRPIAAFLTGRSPNSIPLEAVTGALLDGERGAWKILAGNPELHRETEVHDALAEWIGSNAARDIAPFPTVRDELHMTGTLLDTVEQLDLIGPMSVAHWLHQVAKTGASTEPGLSPDSVALLLFKRLLEADFGLAKEFVGKSLDLRNFPALRLGYFQLSILGSLVAHLTKRKPSSETRDWLTALLETPYDQSRFNGGGDAMSISAMLLAALFFTLENSVDAAHRLDSTLRNYARKVDRKERKYFFQLLSDTLGQFLSDGNSPHHWYKLLVLCRYLKKESVVWSEVGLLPLLTRTFLRPARRVLFR